MFGVLVKRLIIFWKCFEFLRTFFMRNTTSKSVRICECVDRRFVMIYYQPIFKFVLTEKEKIRFGYRIVSKSLSECNRGRSVNCCRWSINGKKLSIPMKWLISLPLLCQTKKIYLLLNKAFLEINKWDAPK